MENKLHDKWKGVKRCIINPYKVQARGKSGTHITSSTCSIRFLPSCEHMVLSLNQSHFVSAYLFVFREHCLMWDGVLPEWTVPREWETAKQQHEMLRANTARDQKHRFALASKTHESPQTFGKESATNLPIVPYLQFNLTVYLIWNSRAKIPNESSVYFRQTLLTSKSSVSWFN